MNYSKNAELDHDFFENVFQEMKSRGSRDVQTFTAEEAEAFVADLGDDKPKRKQEPDWSKKVAEPLPSKKVARRFRRSDRNDKEALKKIQKVGSTAITSGLTTVRNFHPSTPTPNNSSSATNDNALPAWEHTGDRLKVVSALRSLSAGAYSFSLNIGPSRLHAAVSDSNGFARHLRRVLNDALKREIDHVPLYIFTVDISQGGKLHLHGAIETMPLNRSGIERAFAFLSGPDWTPNRDGELQLHWGRLCTPDIWATYILRNGPRVRQSSRASQW